MWIVWRHKIALMDPLRAPARQPFEGAAETATAVCTSAAAAPSSKSPEFPVLSSDVAPMRRSKAARDTVQARIPGCRPHEGLPAPGRRMLAECLRHGIARPGEVEPGQFAADPFARQVVSGWRTQDF